MEFKEYGTNSKMDKLVDSESYVERIKAAEQRYALDVLVNDDNWEVRCAVAKQGRDKELDILVRDLNGFVRKTVAECERPQDLDILVNDDDWRVRAAVAKCGRPQDLDILANDNQWQVRATVASHGREKVLNILENDKEDFVREEVVAKLGHRLQVGDEVCISTQALYERFGKHLSQCSISLDKSEGADYYDMYNNEGEVCCMDGEMNRVDNICKEYVVFSNKEEGEPVKFTLSSEEVEVAVFQAYNKESIIQDKKKSTIDIEKD